MEKYKKEKLNKDKNVNMKKTNSNFKSTLRKSINKEENKNNNLEKKIKEENQKEKEIHITNQTKIKELTEELNKLEKEYKEIEKQNINLNKENNTNSNYISLKKQNISTKKIKLSSLKESNLKLEKQLSDLQKEFEEEKNENENEVENRPISISELFQNVMMRLNNNPINFYNLNNNQNIINDNDTGLTMEQLLNLPNSKYNKLDNNSEKCNICGFVFCYNDTISKLERCRHIFHRECLFNYLQNRTSSKCPICKVRII